MEDCAVTNEIIVWVLVFFSISMWVSYKFMPSKTWITFLLIIFQLCLIALYSENYFPSMCKKA